MIKNPTLRKIVNITLTVLLIAAIFLFVLTFSIGLPIYCRFFHTLQIEPLNMVEESGYSKEQIIEAYNEILDFCTLPNKPCTTGAMPLSESGAAHFADCKVLFDLNLGVLLGSAAVIITVVLLNHFKVIELRRLFKRSVYFWGGVCGVAIPAVVACLAAIDFDQAFYVFHLLFFPGKDNWYFSWQYDQIIRVMPQEFFMNCAILIAVSVITLSALLVIFSLLADKKAEKVKAASLPRYGQHRKD